MTVAIRPRSQSDYKQPIKKKKINQEKNTNALIHLNIGTFILFSISLKCIVIVL